MRSIIAIVVAIVVLPYCSYSQRDSLITDYEASGGMRTPRYNETMAYCRRLEAASPWIHVTTFGVSAQGRQLPLVILSKETAFDPRTAAATGKAIMLIQSGIHAGEIDGKDASLMLMRDIAVRKTYASLLDHAILLFVPIFNVDGHERFGPYNRINQNGPEEMGWRVNAQNLNLNRDYMKADAPEMRAMLALMTAWLPDFLVDCHVTDGIDFQYDVTYAMETGPNIDASISRWIEKSLMPSVIPVVEKSGHKIFSYVFPREDNDLSKGLTSGAGTPRFSTGYGALQNRPTMLIETHMLKPYKIRVDATYHLLRALMMKANEDVRVLRALVRGADQKTIAMGNGSNPVLPIKFGLGEKFSQRRFLGIRSIIRKSGVTGAQQMVYTGEPVEATIPFFDEITVEDSVTVPYAYIIPAEWISVRDVLLAHGITIERLASPCAVEVESYRFENPKTKARSFEGRNEATFKTTPTREVRNYPEGTMVVRTGQRTGRVIVNLLEPRGPDSFVAWGFFNAIFEQKEYAETYVMDEVGKKMLAENAALRTEYEAKVAADTAFANNPESRLNWLYNRSLWADPTLNVYPIGRLMHRDPRMVME